MRLWLALAMPFIAAAGELPTPVGERVVTLGALDKRTSATREYKVKVGEAVAFDRLTLIVRTCEASPPWEEPLEGAFVQIDERKKRGGVERAFSGWLFAQSPSLSAFEHPDYDIWLKACAMRFPETGPDTTVASAPSRAKKSPRRETAPDNSAR